MGTDDDVDNVESSIEACRTCGTYFFSSSSLLRQLFNSGTIDSEMELIHQQLKSWDIQINENDPYAKYICTGCIHEFQRIFKFRGTCLDTQNQLHFFHNMRKENIKIKTEMVESAEVENNFTFIYVDDLSEDEDGASTVLFNFAHIPIKIEKEVEVENPIKIKDSQNFITQDSHLKVGDIISLPTGSSKTSEKNDLGVRNIKIENESKSREEMKFNCGICSYFSTNESALTNHIQLYHETKDHECHVCGKKFLNSTYMRFKYHLKWHKISKHVRCPQCGFYCGSKQILTEHKRAVHAKVSCHQCGKSFTSKRLKIHLRETHLESKFLNPIRSQVFENIEKLNEHTWNAHCDDNVLTQVDTESLAKGNDETFVVICAKCNATFNSTEVLAVHVKEAHFCVNTNSVNNENLKDNKKIRNTIEGNNFLGDVTRTGETNMPISDTVGTLFKFSCSECCQMFETVEDLQEHYLLHSQIKPCFICTICNKSFELKFSLNRHLRKHNSDVL